MLVKMGGPDLRELQTLSVAHTHRTKYTYCLVNEMCARTGTVALQPVEDGRVDCAKPPRPTKGKGGYTELDT